MSKFIIYINSMQMNPSQIRRNSDAKTILFKYGIKEEKTINVMNDNNLISRLKKFVRKLEYPIIEIDGKIIGNLQDLKEYTEKLEIEKTRKMEDETMDDESEEELNVNVNQFNSEPNINLDDSSTNKTQKVEDKNQLVVLETVQIEVKTMKKEEVENKQQDLQEIEKKQDLQEEKQEDLQQKQEKEQILLELIESKQESVEKKTKELSSLKVSGFVSYPLHLLESGFKYTVSGFFNMTSIFNRKKEKQEEKEKFIQIPVLKTNWYGRIQKRYLKFFCNRIERFDASHSLRQTHFLKDISKIVVTAPDFFYLILSNGSQEFYQTPDKLLEDLLDLFKSAQQINPSLVVSVEISKESDENLENNEKEEK